MLDETSPKMVDITLSFAEMQRKDENIVDYLTLNIHHSQNHLFQFQSCPNDNLILP